MNSMRTIHLSLIVTFSTLLTLSVFAAGSPPETLHYSCSSQELGILDIKLKKPQQLMISSSIQYYDMDVTYMNAQGVRIAQGTYDTSDENNARARLSLEERNMNNPPVIHFTIPPQGQVDWASHPDKCYVQAPAPGIQFSLFLNPLKVGYEQYSKPYFFQALTNPQVQFTIKPGIGFGTIVYTLNGKPCEDNNSILRMDTELKCQEL